MNTYSSHLAEISPLNTGQSNSPVRFSPFNNINTRGNSNPLTMESFGTPAKMINCNNSPLSTRNSSSSCRMNNFYNTPLKMRNSGGPFRTSDCDSKSRNGIKSGCNQNLLKLKNSSSPIKIISCKSPLSKILGWKQEDKFDNKVYPDELPLKRFVKRRKSKSEGNAETIKKAKQELSISVFSVTWNMNEKKAIKELEKLVSDDTNVWYDFYVIGLQEAPIKGKVDSSFLEALGDNYRFVGSSSYYALRLFVFCKASFHADIKDIKANVVSQGSFFGFKRQKGAVALTFIFKGFSFLFISCHLAAHEYNVELRNKQLSKIKTRLFVEEENSPRPTAGMDSADVVVLVGDLNYRVQETRQVVDIYLQEKRHISLAKKDQLTRERGGCRVLLGFQEGILTFKPTFKFDVGTDNYDSSRKRRVPSWTDRVLYKINRAANVKAEIKTYDSIESIKVSDHKPVKALLHLKLTTQSITHAKDTVQ